MKILLVVPYMAIGAVYTYLTSLGLLSLGTLLKANNYAVEIVDFNHSLQDSPDRGGNHDQNLHDMIDYILDKQPDVIGFYTMCSSLQNVLRITRMLKERGPAVKIIIGGPQSDHLPERIIEAFPWIDAVCVGEGENVILDLVKGLSTGNLKGVAGIVYRDRDKVVRNPHAPLLEDLDKLPVIDYGLVPYRKGARIALEIGRGCPYQCTFCSSSRYWRHKHRTKSLTRIRQEIEGIKQYVPPGEKVAISFVDDNFTTNRRFVLDLCMLLQEMDVVWDCCARFDTLDEELLKQMDRAGCVAVFFGVETASPRLQSSINKHLRLDKFTEIIDLILQYRIQPMVSFMYGFPSETVLELKQTLTMISALLRKGVAHCGLHALCILGGTKMYEENMDRLVLRGQCSNIADACGLNRENKLIAGHKDLFPHLYTLEGSLAEQFLFLEKFTNLVVVYVFKVFPQSIIAILDIFDDDILEFYTDFITTVSEFPAMLNSDKYADLARCEVDLFKYILRCYFTYISLKAMTDVRFDLVKYRLQAERAK